MQVREGLFHGIVVKKIGEVSEFGAHFTDGIRKFDRAPGGFAEPEGDGRLRAMGIFDTNGAASDVANAPGVCATQEAIAGKALDGEILVNGADDFLFGLDEDVIEGRIRDGAAGSDGGEARAATSAQTMIHLIAMDQSAVTSA